MSEAQPPSRRRQMATPIGEQRGTVSRLELPRGARPGADPLLPGQGETVGTALGTVRKGGRNGGGNGQGANGGNGVGGRGPGDRRGRGRLVSGAIVLVGLLALAAAIIIGGLTLARPAVGSLARSMAEDNPQTLKLPFVADLVRDQLGSALTDAAGSDASPIDFEVPSGATARQVAEALTAQGLISDPLVFEFLTVTGGQSRTIRAGDYTLTRLMTPQQILARLQQPPDPLITLALRSGLRIEQVAAYLETRGLGPSVPRDFYELAEHPTAGLRADYPFLAALPAGASLEGFLGGSTWAVKPTATADQILRHLLTAWSTQMGPDLVAQAEKGGQDFFRALVLASIVQQEAALDSERPLIAGVYANRLNPKVWSTGLLNADPTVFYANDTVQLRDLDFAQWQGYYFWKPVDIALNAVTVPEDLVSFQTYTHAGLPDWPICSPNRASLEAALDPDTSTGYLYFVAKGDGSDSHAFAKTNAEFQQLLKDYGYVR